MKLIALLSSDFWGGLRQQKFEMFFSMLAWETAIRGKSACKKEERKGKIFLVSSLGVKLWELMWESIRAGFVLMVIAAVIGSFKLSVK